MDNKNEYIWDDNNLIKPRCLKCFILFPRIIESEYYYNELKYDLICDYCRYKENIDLHEYLKFIKSNNIQIPLCSHCNQNLSTYINSCNYTYFCDNCIEPNEIRDYKNLKNNFNNYYCKKHNSSFKFINNGEPYCEICFSNLIESKTKFGPLSHSYPLIYNKIKNNLENFKKDKIYIESLISEIKNKYPESEEKRVKKNEEDDDEYTFSNFNEYYNNKFLININSLIEFIEILLPNYNPSKLNENLSLTLELFLYYRKISKFNFEEFEKNESKWYFLYEYLEDYFNPFNIYSHKINLDIINENKLKFEINETENLSGCIVLKDGRIAGKIKNKIVIFDIGKTINNIIKFDIMYKLEEFGRIIELENGNLLLDNGEVYKIENNTLIKIKEIEISRYSVKEIINLSKNRIAISFNSWGYSITIYEGNTLEEIETLPTKDYASSCCQLLNKEILALSIWHESDIEFWSLEDYSLIFRIKNIYPGIIINYKTDKIICSSNSGYALYIINTKLFKIENVFKSPSFFDVCFCQARFLYNYLIIDKSIILLKNDTACNKYFNFISYHKNDNYSYILTEDSIIIYDLRKNDLYSIKKKLFLNIFE